MGSLLQFNQAVSVLKHGFEHAVLSIDGPTRRYPIAGDRLFTNKAADSLLVNAGDLKYYAWKEAPMAQSICGLKALQNRMQGKPGTYAVILLVPDKLQAYSEFIERGGPVTGKDWYAAIAENKGLHVPRLDKAIAMALQQGVKDLYLPNDTHWGTRGHRLAADMLVDYLLEHGVFDEMTVQRSAE